MTVACILSGYAPMRDGYRKVLWQGKRELHHRVVYVQAHGLNLADIHGKVIRHTCDNPGCINPDHLLAGTQRQNIHDCIARNQSSKNSRRFGDAEVAAIRQERGSLQTIATKYATSVSVISRIINRKDCYK